MIKAWESFDPAIFEDFREIHRWGDDDSSDEE
jgi:hypothetical protein